MRILIVDDERAARQRLLLMLDELDVEVVGEAENGVEALSLVRERAPDVLLLDIAMPEVDGLDVVRHLRAPQPLIIFQTAHPVHAPEAFDHDAVDFLVKPVNLQRLQRALDRGPRRAHRTRHDRHARIAPVEYAARTREPPPDRRREGIARGLGRTQFLRLDGTFGPAHL